MSVFLVFYLDDRLSGPRSLNLLLFTERATAEEQLRAWAHLGAEMQEKWDCLLVDYPATHRAAYRATEHLTQIRPVLTPDQIFGEVAPLTVTATGHSEDEAFAELKRLRRQLPADHACHLADDVSKASA